MVLYTAAIVGCGRIGVAFDSPDYDAVLTHAKAFSLHPKVQLVGVMDIDYHVARVAATKWKCIGYTNFQQMMIEQHPDIISLCVPDQFHFEYLLQCLKFQPRAVISEKPLTHGVKQSEIIVKEYRDSGIPLFVNYTRRYDSTVQTLKGRIDSGGLGSIISTTIKYTKGILHNGSHAIDIANYLFGECLSGQPLGRVVDYAESDPTLSVTLQYAKCPEVLLIACDERVYSIFEIDIIAEKGRAFFEQFGFRYKEYAVRKDPIFKGYKDLALINESDTDLKQSLFKLVDNTVNHIDKGATIVCSGNDALLAQRICNALILSEKDKRQRIVFNT